MSTRKTNPNRQRFRLSLTAIAAGIKATSLISTAAADTTQAPTVVRLTPIQIQGTRVGTSTSIHGLAPVSVNETPLSISTISSEFIRDYGYNSLSGLMRLEPATGDSYNTLGYVESLQVRGFLLDNRFNYQRDGLPISNHMPIALENKERIELLKGPNGMLAGVSAPGGLMNSVIKRSPAQTLRELNIQFSEKGSAWLHADLGDRLKITNTDALIGYRFNFAGAQRRPFFDRAPGRREFFSALVDYRQAGHLMEAEVEHHRSSQVSVPGLALLDVDGDGVGERLPAVPAARLNLNQQSWTLPFVSHSTIASVRYESPSKKSNWGEIRWGIRANQQNIKTDDRIAFPDGCSAQAVYVYPGLCANYDVDIYDYRSENERRKFNNQQVWLSVETQFAGLQHQLRLSSLRSQYRERYAPLQTYNYAGTINALNPTPLAAAPDPSSPNTNYDRLTSEFSLSDRISFGGSVPGSTQPAHSLWLGVRHVRLNASSIVTDGSATTRYQQSLTSPWAAWAFQFARQQMVYFSWGQGIESEVVPNRPTQFTNAGAALAALKSKQLELGLKAATPSLSRGLPTGQLNLALYQIAKPFADDLPASDGTNRVTRVTNARLSRHQGFELSWQQVVHPQIDVYTSLSLLNARSAKDAQALYTNKRTPNVEPASMTLAVGWQPSANLRWQNTLSYNAGKYVTRENSVQLPASWQLDSWLNFQQRFSAQRLTWRLGVDNLFDRRYWRDAPTQSWGGTYLFAAQPRTFRASLSLNL